MFKLDYPSPYRRGHRMQAIRDIIALLAQGKPLRAIAAAAQAKGHRISHEGVAGVLRAAGR
jgi:hypothetical protein